MSKRPNFLIILADDLGFSDVGAFGSEIKTPATDRLMSKGLRFTDFHTASACSPTRSMLLTGTDHHIAGIGTMIESIQEFQRGQPGYEGYLNDSVVALPELLRDAGYFTLMSGKWHLGLTPDRWPCSRGFERSFTLLPGAANHYAWEPQLEDGDSEPQHFQNTRNFYAENDCEIAVKDLGPNYYSSDTFTDKLIQYLQERSSTDREKPFFAYLPYSAPHWPLQAPDADIEPYLGRYDSGPEVLRQKRLQNLKAKGLVPDHARPHDVVAPAKDRLLSKQWDELTDEEKRFSARTMEAYAGMVQRMDTNIGRVFKYLEDAGEYDNTFILFMSDNGAEGHWLESKPMIPGNPFDHIAKYYDNSIANIGKKNSYVWYGPHWASAATAPGRLYKAFTSEGGIRVPFLARYPPLTEQASTIDNGIVRVFSTVMDIAPTFLELAGIPGPHKTYKGREVAPVRGRSWVQFLKNLGEASSGSNAIHDDDAITSWELFGRTAVRQGKWKALSMQEPYGTGRWQLYDLDEDPGETNDVAAQHRDRLRMLVDAWHKYRQDVGVAGEAHQFGTLVLD